MTKRFIFCCSLFFILALPSRIWAQTEVTAVESLLIQLWPDYDRTAVLVLLTGTVPADTPLPATVTIPLPETAALNAVARLATEGTLVDDIAYTTEAGQLTLTTPDPTFRVEYYVPYVADNDQRRFTFAWQAGMAVDQLDIQVQQPAAASSMQTEPATTDIQTRNDGLTYYTFSEQDVLAGESVTVDVSYMMSTPQLSVDLIVPATGETAANTPPLLPPEQPATINWPLILAGLGGFLIISALVWQVAVSSRSRTRRPRKARPRPKPRRTRKTGQANFCHECGRPLQAGDRFCRDCGTAVKAIRK
jgi:hypothetical protein